MNKNLGFKGANMKNNKIPEQNKTLQKITLDAVNSNTEDLLSHYFSIDGNAATVRLVFDTFSELVDQNFGDDRVERLNSTLFDKITEVFALIPRKYFINLDVYIRDFGDYSIEEAEKIIVDNIKLRIYSYELERKRKLRTAQILALGGALLLLISYFLNNLALPQLIYDLINISGTLLVWESANVMLIERGADAKHAKQLAKKFKKVRILQANTDNNFKKD